MNLLGLQHYFKALYIQSSKQEKILLFKSTGMGYETNIMHFMEELTSFFAIIMLYPTKDIL